MSSSATELSSSTKAFRRPSHYYPLTGDVIVVRNGSTGVVLIPTDTAQGADTGSTTWHTENRDFRSQHDRWPLHLVYDATVSVPIGLESLDKWIHWDLADGNLHTLFHGAFAVEDDVSTALGGEPDYEDAQAPIRQRLLLLANLAEVEGLTVSEASHRDLLRFFTTHPDVRRPRIYLLENGNYRAVWKSEDGEQIALQFRGNEEIQYVIFAKREYPPMFSRSSGRDSFRGIERQIDASGIRRLMQP